MSRLSEPIAKVVAAKRDAEGFAALGILTVGDLVRHYPRRYERLGLLTPLAALALGEPVTVLAEVVSAKAIRMRQRDGEMLKVVITDGSDTLDVTFFNAKRLKYAMTPGRQALFSGTVELYQGARQLSHPKVQLLGAGADADELIARVDEPIPIYPASARTTSAVIGRAIRVVLDTLGEIEDPLPAEIRSRHGLLGLRQALELVHRPREDADYRSARHRLRFEEAFVLQAALARRRWTEQADAAMPRHAVAGGLLDAFDARLPFELTRGQRQVGEELARDLAAIHPMHRLLQGEVGSGKTVVALRAMLTVVDSGGQAALLAPTEVLAAQHHRSMTGMLGDLASRGLLGGDERGTRVVLLTGSMPAAARKAALLDLASGDAGIVVGTHALLAERVSFFDLGLVVVDEQHRFGVEQRDALRGKGKTAPHLLVMTATPIPRTVAMTVFGDLEISTLRELPAGRAAIATHVVPVGERPAWLERTWARVREEVDAGRQCYVVCPRIGGDGPEGVGEDGPLGEDGFDGPVDRDPVDREPVDRDPVDDDLLQDRLDDDVLQDRLDVAGAPGGPSGQVRERQPAVAVLDLLPRLRDHAALRDLRIEILHGRMPSDARDAAMRAFAAGELDVLLATTIVEVGLDVPRASAMVVMDADRFGVSQLHQLRGRVGRGSSPGVCLLVTLAEPGSPARERLAAVARTLDGFELARVDLEARREGDVLGAAQSGTRSSLRLLRVLRDEKLIETARHEASAVVVADPDLTGNPALAEAIALLLGAEREAYLDRG